MIEPESDLAALLSAFERPHASLPQQARIAQRLIEVLPIPVFFKQRDGHYLGVNKAWEDFFGMPREAILGRGISHLYAHAPAIAAVHESMDQRLWQSPGRQSYEMALTMLDGRIRHALYHKATFTDATGAVVGLIGTVIDITDRKHIEQRQSVEHAVTRFLAESQSTGHAVRGILQVICERLGWACAARWQLDDKDGRLRCIERWCIDDEAIRQFQEVGARQSFLPVRKGLIREVFATGASWWIPDLREKGDFLRGPLAAAAGLRSGFALPIRIDQRVAGVIEFFSREVRPQDAWMLETATSVGALIGQLMARREAEAATRESEARFRSLTELSSDWYWEQDANGILVMLSGGFTAIFGVAADALIGQPLFDTERTRQIDFAARAAFQDVEFSRVGADGQVHHASVSGRPFFDAAGRFAGYRGVGKDITQRKAYEEALEASNAQLEYQANFDALTGLPNRHLLEDRVGQLIARRGETGFCVVFIDLDHFKPINDGLGHDVGDELLRAIGKRLQNVVRAGDTVARVGGDEFVLLMDHSLHADAVRRIGLIFAEMAAPIIVNGHQLAITCSAGVSVYPRDGRDLAELLKTADTAMYRAKAQGPSRYEFYSAPTSM